MSNNLHCHYCDHPRNEDVLTKGKDRLTKLEAWACNRHRSFLTMANRHKKTTLQQMDEYGLFRGA